MLKKFLITVFIVMVITQCFAQDFDTICNGEKVRYSYGNKSNFSMVVNTPYLEYADDRSIPAKVINKNKENISRRIGDSFFINRTLLKNVYIVDFSKFNTIKKSKPWINSNADRRVKYAFSYLINFGAMKYYFTTVYDIDGNLLSTQQLPDYQRNSKFDKIIDMCNANKIAKHYATYKGLEVNTSLEYSDKANCFVWQIERTAIKKNRTEKNEIIILNANSGKLIKKYLKDVSSICNGNTPPMPNLRK